MFAAFQLSASVIKTNKNKGETSTVFSIIAVDNEEVSRSET